MIDILSQLEHIQAFVVAAIFLSTMFLILSASIELILGKAHSHSYIMSAMYGKSGAS